MTAGARLGLTERLAAPPLSTVILVSRWTTEFTGVIIYAELTWLEASAVNEQPIDIRELAKTIIETDDLVRFFPPGAWPDEHFGVMVVQRGLGNIISDPYLVETADARRV